MKVGRISAKDLQLACLALSDGAPELTPADLLTAIKAYDPNGRQTAGPLPGQVLTLAETAERLRLSERTVLRLIEGGELKALRFGTGKERKKVRVSEAALLEFEAAAGE